MSNQTADYEEKLRRLTQLLKRKEKQWRDSSDKMSAAVDQLSAAAEGQEHSLDHVIAELRASMSEGGPSPALINKLNMSSRAMVAIRRSRAQKQLQGFSDCIAQLLLLDPPSALKKQLAEFVRQARRVISDPAQQELMPIKLAKIQAAVLSQHRPEQNADEQADGSEAVAADVEELFKDDMLKDLPPFSSVAEHIESVLLDMVVQIRAPEKAQVALNKARQILSAGLNWYELAALLEHLSSVIIASLETDQQEFELFLQLLNERLSGVNDGCLGMGDIANEFFESGEQLDQELRQDMQSLAGEVAEASSLPSLQHSVRSHLDSVLGQLDEYKLEREKQAAGYQEEVSALRERVQELEVAAEAAQKELEEKQQRSERDSLTELPNREAYDRRVSLELERFNRYDRGFCLVVADIDHFKQINDNFGHLAGDKVLRVIAKTVRQRLRRADFIARYGGEEFVILLPETTAETALKVIDQVREQVGTCPFHFKNDPLNITVSFGITDCQPGDDEESIFVRADKALYLAKSNGRNRCELQAQMLDKSA